MARKYRKAYIYFNFSTGEVVECYAKNEKQAIGILQSNGLNVKDWTLDNVKKVVKTGGWWEYV